MKKIAVLLLVCFATLCAFSQHSTTPTHQVSLCKDLSSPAYDFSPSFIDDSCRSIIFASSRIPDGREYPRYHLFYSHLNKGKWEIPVAIDTIMSQYGQNAVITIDKKRKIIFFTRCPIVKNQNPKCGIYYSFMNGELIGDPIPLIFPHPEGSFNFGHPYFSNELQTLFFSSDMPGGHGDLDIWFIKYDSKTDTWSSPQNAGSEINTAKGEVFPAVRSDGTLYFSSDGHQGFGKWDIFRARKNKDLSWQEPENMGTPVNSEGDDFGITFRGNTESGYFSSNREGGLGNDDIYSFSKDNAPAFNYLSASGENSTIQALTVIFNKESCPGESEILQVSNAQLNPNPNNGDFIFSFNSNKNTDLTIRMYSTTGQVISAETVPVSKGVYQKIYTFPNTTAGIYYVQVLHNCEILYTEKFILK